MDDRAIFELTESRKAKDSFLRLSTNSPLTNSQKVSFMGLTYFEYDQAFRFQVGLEPCPAEEIPIRTNSGDVRTYLRAGCLVFEVEGEAQRLTALATGEDEDLFLPFSDATSRKETYPGGRYLDLPRPQEDGIVLLDFNYAYNPYCAYSSAWTCPLPPTENKLSAAIRAGERVFNQDHCADTWRL